MRLTASVGLTQFGSDAVRGFCFIIERFFGQERSIGLKIKRAVVGISIPICQIEKSIVSRASDEGTKPCTRRIHVFCSDQRKAGSGCPDCGKGEIHASTSRSAEIGSTRCGDSVSGDLDRSWSKSSGYFCRQTERSRHGDVSRADTIRSRTSKGHRGRGVSPKSPPRDGHQSSNISCRRGKRGQDRSTRVNQSRRNPRPGGHSPRFRPVRTLTGSVQPCAPSRGPIRDND